MSDEDIENSNGILGVSRAGHYRESCLVEESQHYFFHLRYNILSSFIIFSIE